MTSNSEKNLPDAFLRRCVFFNITFPEPNDQLLAIAKSQLGEATPYTDDLATGIDRKIQSRTEQSRPKTTGYR